MSGAVTSGATSFAHIVLCEANAAARSLRWDRRNAPRQHLGVRAMVERGENSPTQGALPEYPLTL